MLSSHSATLWRVVQSTLLRLAPSILILLILSVSTNISLHAQSLEQLAVGPPQIHRIEPPPASSSAHELESVGDALQTEKNYLDAIDYYKAAMVKDPHNAVLPNKMGISQLQLHRYKEARKAFELSIRTDKSYANAYANLGVVYYDEGSFGKSIRSYDKAILLNKNEAVFYSNRAASLFSKKEFVKASQDYAKAVELDRDILERSERGAAVQAKLASPQDRAHYDYVLAKLYAQNGMPERSLHYLRRAMEDGYRDIKDVYKDSEFITLRKDPRFAELMASKPVSIPE